MAELIISILVLLVFARALGELFERFRQSALIGEVLAGVILGPALLGFISSPDDLAEMAVVSNIGVFLLVLLAGLEMSMDEVVKSLRGGGLMVGAIAFSLPFVLGFLLGQSLSMGANISLFVGLAVAVTALPVSVRILLDLGIADSPIGRLIVSAAILNDLLALTIFGILLNLRDASASDPLQTATIAGWTVLKTAILVLVVVAFARAVKISGAASPGAQRRMRSLLSLFRGREALFALAILFVLVFASISELLGLHFVVGAFFGGLVLSSQLLGEYNYRQFERTTSALSYGFLAPVFFGYIGLQLVPDAIVQDPVLTLSVLGVAVVGKVGGGLVGGRLAKLPGPMSLALGFGLNARGLIEIVVAGVAYQTGFIDARLFSVLILMTLITTLMAPPLLKWSLLRAERRLHQRREERAGPPAPPRAPDAAAAPASSLLSAPVVIVGGGRVALEVARAVGSCTVLERDPERAKALAAGLAEVKIVIGDAADPAALKQAGVGPDAVVVAATDDDEANEAVVRAARAAGARRIVARAEGSGQDERLRRAGADAVVNAAQETAAATILELYPPDASMEEVLVPKESSAVGQTLEGLGLPRGAIVRSVTRRGRVHVPTADLVLDARDSLILSGTPVGLKRAREILLGSTGALREHHVLAVHARDGASARAIAMEVAPLAALSRGAVLLAVPGAGADAAAPPAVSAAFSDAGTAVQVVPANGMNPGDLLEVLESARGPAPQVDPSLPANENRAPDAGVWLLAVAGVAVGKDQGKLMPRKLIGLPVGAGAPVYVARRGMPPRSVSALIDGAEGADRAGTLACDIARLLGARMQVIVVRFEDDPEPLEQAAYIESYSRNIGLGTIDRADFEHPTVAAIENALRSGRDLLVSPSVPRAVRSNFLAQLASAGETSVLLV